MEKRWKRSSVSNQAMMRLMSFQIFHDSVKVTRGRQHPRPLPSHVVCPLIRTDELEQRQPSRIRRCSVAIDLDDTDVQQVDKELEALDFLGGRSSPDDAFVEVLAHHRNLEKLLKVVVQSAICQPHCVVAAMGKKPERL